MTFSFFLSFFWKVAAEQNTSWTAVKVCISESNLFTERKRQRNKKISAAAAGQMSRSCRRRAALQPRSLAPGIALQSHANSCVKDGFLHSHGSQVLLGPRPNHGAPPRGHFNQTFCYSCTFIHITRSVDRLVAEGSCLCRPWCAPSSQVRAAKFQSRFYANLS